MKIGIFKIELTKAQKDNILDISFFKELNEEKEFIIYNDLHHMYSDLKKGIINYFILPSRNTSTNEVFDGCIELVLRLNLEKIIEIYTFVTQINFDATPLDPEKTLIEDLNVLKFGNRYYSPSDNLNEFEFKIFKNNTYKTSFWTKFFIFLFANKYSTIVSMLFNVVSVLLLIVAFVFALTPELNNILPIEVTILADALPLLTIAAQVLLKIFDVDDKAKRKMITGKWIYYSFEDQYEKGNYVPKGFTTRLFEITNIGDNLTFSCKFSGSDTLFFSTQNNDFDYNYSTRFAQGIYSYTSNIINSKGKRADGVCKYEGRANKNDVITFMDGWFTGRGTGIRGRVKYFRISDEDFDILEKAYTKSTSLTFKNTTINVGIFGDPKSNTDNCFDEYFSNIDLLKDAEIIKKYYSNLSDFERDFNNHAIDFALIPTINRNKEITNNLIFENNKNASKIGTKDVEISYQLGTKNKDYKLNENTVFYSHIQALTQCDEFIKSVSNKTMLATSTSAAAKHIMLNYCDKDVVCISNEESIKHYNLYQIRNDKGEIISPYINKEKNITTFSFYKFN